MILDTETKQSGRSPVIFGLIQAKWWRSEGETHIYFVRREKMRFALRGDSGVTRGKHTGRPDTPREAARALRSGRAGGTCGLIHRVPERHHRSEALPLPSKYTLKITVKGPGACLLPPLPPEGRAQIPWRSWVALDSSLVFLP